MLNGVKNFTDAEGNSRSRIAVHLHCNALCTKLRLPFLHYCHYTAVPWNNVRVVLVDTGERGGWTPETEMDRTPQQNIANGTKLDRPRCNFHKFQLFQFLYLASSAILVQF